MAIYVGKLKVVLWISAMILIATVQERFSSPGKKLISFTKPTIISESQDQKQ